MEIKFLDDRLKDFEQATSLSAGYDLRCCEDSEVILLPGQTEKIKTGIAVSMGIVANSYLVDGSVLNYCAVVMPRSSLGCRGVKPRNVPGLIDADYQGEIMLCMHNESDVFVSIRPMERIAQLVFMLAVTPQFVIVDEFGSKTVRGDNGFGSTGTH
jgi:dUTP pyrophosphatase